MRNEQLTLRLTEGALGLRVGPETRARHLAVLRLEPGRTVVETQPTLWVRARRAIAGVAVGMVVAAPTGVAVASTDALPGERLYPVKLAVERVMGLFSDDIAARHRVAELQALIERQAGDDLISRTSEAAERAVVGLPHDHPLQGVLAQIKRDEAEKKADEEAERERLAEEEEAAREAAEEAAEREREAAEEAAEAEAEAEEEAEESAPKADDKADGKKDKDKKGGGS